MEINQVIINVAIFVGGAVVSFAIKSFLSKKQDLERKNEDSMRKDIHLLLEKVSVIDGELKTYAAQNKSLFDGVSRNTAAIDGVNKEILEIYKIINKS